MALTLTIENETSLPDGGPMTVRVTGRRGIDIGRDSHLDWTLPDPTRFISGKHAEVRHQDGGYWLYDVSTNGTFLNGSDRRLQQPHRLRHGDRVEIGQYIIAVTIDGEATAEAPPVAEAARPSPNSQEFWSGVGEVAAPIASRDLQRQKPAAPGRPDFLDWAVEAPVSDFRQAPPPPEQAAQPTGPDLDWARGPAPQPAQAEVFSPIPSPRRPGGEGAVPANPWVAAPLGAEPDEPERPPPTASWEDLPPIGSPPPEPQPTIPPASAPPAALPELPAVMLAPEPPARISAFAPAIGASPAAPGVNFVQHLARGAGVPEDIFAQHDPAKLAELVGSLLRLSAEDLKQLLGARAEAKRFARSTSQTMVQALDNNPLKFAPSAEDALRIMFAPPSRGYLDARRAFEQGFKDLKTHQVKTFSAMQAALRLLVEDLDPEAIDEATEPDKGISAVLGSRKAKLWDIYTARWNAKTQAHDDGLVDAFMLYFSECYDRGSGGK